MYPEYCGGCYKLEPMHGGKCVYPDPAAKIGLKADGSVSLGCAFNAPTMKAQEVKLNPLKASKRSKR